MKYPHVHSGMSLATCIFKYVYLYIYIYNRVKYPTIFWWSPSFLSLSRPGYDPKLIITRLASSIVYDLLMFGNFAVTRTHPCQHLSSQVVDQK
jgi:lysylphosphatidylglycerol synthetase-like protein (DUF2156 family)